MGVIRQQGLRGTASDLTDVWVFLFFICTAHCRLVFIADDRLLPPETAINITLSAMDWQRPFDGLARLMIPSSQRASRLPGIRAVPGRA